MSEYVANDIVLRLNERDAPSLVINGVEMAGAILPDWRIESFADENGLRQAHLTVTFPVLLS